MDRSVRRLDLAFRSVPRQALLAAAALLLAPAVAAGVFAGWNGISDAQARSAGATAVASARQQIDRDQRVGVDGQDLAGLRQSLDRAAAQDRDAHSAAGHRAAAAAAAGIEAKAADLGRRQEAENRAIQAGSIQLAGSADSLGALQQSGHAALVADRNEATVAVWAGAHGRPVPGLRDSQGAALGPPEEGHHDLDQGPGAGGLREREGGAENSGDHRPAA